MREDIAGDITTGQLRLAMYFQSNLATFQWQLHQARRGLLPTFAEALLGRGVGGLFTGYRSFESWWEATKFGFVPEFVEFVEEQRSKAA